jgi:amino acid adenylation domain-containing protein
MTAGEPQQELLNRLRSVVDRHGDEIAVREAGGTWTYDHLAASIATIRRELATTPSRPGAPVGLLVERSAVAYATMWAALSLGRTYAPLNPGHPAARLDQIVEQAGIDTVVCASGTRDRARRLGAIGERPIVADDLEPARPEDVDAIWQATPGADVAYLMFTSGSTGRPKGVPISYANLLAFVDAMGATIPVRPGDRCSQVCELSFDFSVHEIYLALLNGGTLCPARPIDLFDPARYVAANGLTVWVAVPSLARVVLDGAAPVGERLSSLRLSIFNGEALTAALAARWRAAAPDSAIWNTYGPTECTVAVTHQLWSDGADLEHEGVVAIGTPLPDCLTAIDAGGAVVPTAEARPDTSGELLLAGPQRFPGYLDADLPSPFVTDGDITWYRTGDRVQWRDGRLFHLGRLDHQVKVGGHRIELQEVEHRLRDALGTDALAVIAHPRIQPTELVLCLSGAAPDAITPDGTGLPAYMLPRRILPLPSLPTNANGKLDRQALHRLADAPR